MRVWPGGGEWPQIVAQGDTIHVAAKHIANNVGDIVYIRSTDCGNSWGQLHFLSGDSCMVEFPRLVVNGRQVIVLWNTAFDIGYRRYNIGYSVSSNGGSTWSTPRYILNPNALGNLCYAASGSGTRININIYCSLEGDSTAFYSIRSTNFGQSWFSPQEIFNAFQSGVPDQVGVGNFVHFTWDGRFDMAHPWEIRYLRSSDGGINWFPNIIISDSDQIHSVLTSISAFNPNEVGIAWMDYKYSPYMGTGDIFMRSSSDSGQSWGPERQATFDHFAWNSDIASIGDTNHIIWVDEGTGIAHRSIFYTKSEDNGESWSEPFWIDRTLDDSADPAISVSNGRVYVVWGDGRTNPDTTLRSGLYISRFDPEPDAIHEAENPLPNRLNLAAYPNPFNSTVTIRYSDPNILKINIYDIQGKLIRTLKTEGGENGRIIWDATDALGNRVSSGEYYLKAGPSQGSSGLKILYLK